MHRKKSNRKIGRAEQPHARRWSIDVKCGLEDDLEGTLHDAGILRGLDLAEVS